MSTIAWLLEADGSVLPIVAMRRLVWPGSVAVTLSDGSTRAASMRDVLARDDLDQRHDVTKLSTTT